ncbi:hypothetical protein [uncultured Ruminococcus sp.]|uniref:hypothetical protein n=1 Tax=uncultured Ruminococcus sp. TaxID=165186 RepID=UPI002622C585|nr:hypothetical protein [uncultured Ruminococcus sp.]
MNTKNMKKLPRKRSPLLTAAKAVMLVLSLWFSCAMPALTGAGLISNRASYGEEMEKTGIFFIAAAALMTAGAFLCLIRRDLPDILAIAFSLSGLALCMVMLKKLADHADRSGWTDKYTLLPISEMYTSRIMPCIIPALLCAVLAAVQLCSYGQREQRRRKKAEKDAPAPPII